MNKHQMLIKPVISEKSVSQNEIGKYAFVVSVKADKKSVKEAIEKMFKVKVVDIHMIRLKGKVKSFRRIWGKRSDTKKAVVTLKKGDSIKLFEGAKG